MQNGVVCVVSAMPVSQALPQTWYDPTGPAEPDRAAAPWHTLALRALMLRIGVTGGWDNNLNAGTHFGTPCALNARLDHPHPKIKRRLRMINEPGKPILHQAPQTAKYSLTRLHSSPPCIPARRRRRRLLLRPGLVALLGVKAVPSSSLACATDAPTGGDWRCARVQYWRGP